MTERKELERKELERKELIRDLNIEIMKNNKLKETVKQQDDIIKQLRNTLAELGIETVTKKEIESYEKPKRGRPKKIDNTTRQRIKVLKDSGLPVREIAKKEATQRIKPLRRLYK